LILAGPPDRAVTRRQWIVRPLTQRRRRPHFDVHVDGPRHDHSLGNIGLLWEVHRQIVGDGVGLILGQSDHRAEKARPLLTREAERVSDEVEAVTLRARRGNELFSGPVGYLDLLSALALDIGGQDRADEGRRHGQE